MRHLSHGLAGSASERNPQIIKNEANNRIAHKIEILVDRRLFMVRIIHGK